ncbi:MAG: peptidoglycan editing factor PgeF [Coprococcus sp.]|nr:peptidoglycan editing factor PgeF [Coprococcus sp.]
MDIKYINHSKTTKLHNKNGVLYISFDILDKFGIVNGFSTRIGGVSKEHLSSMNLSFHRGDDPANVMENHKRLGKAAGYDYRKLVFSDQVHETAIYKVTEKDAGKGITVPSDIVSTDGLVTNIPGIPLMTFYADCVPVYFYDPIKKVVAMNHSGWKGTVKNISSHMIETMNREYGSSASDIICAIGPSICQACYEVSLDVAEAFGAAYHEEEYASMMIDKGNGKYQLDLHKANYYNLINSGVSAEHIAVTDICTCCNPALLFSHRASHGMRGNLGGFIMLPEKTGGYMHET